jgi:L-ascorbate metabolism protein UlaG (beta-lactamase superfamily)
MKSNRWFAILAVSVTSLSAAVSGRSQSAKFNQEPACQTLKPASTGGPLPKDPDVAVVRYLGRANYEVAYRGKVLLLDTWYDDLRLSFGERFGIKESDITRADAIFVGHTHFDHFGDAPPIAKRTGAPVFLGPIGARYLKAQGVPDGQIKLVRGGETFKENGYTVQVALAIHMPIDSTEGAASFHDLLSKSDPLTDKEKAETAEWEKGEASGLHMYLNEDPNDPDNETTYHGTFVYVLTFDSGFRLLYSDTAGVLSGGERVLADSIHASGGKIDVGIIGYLQTAYNLPKAIKVTGKRAQVWAPSIFLPSHFHDGEKDELPDMATGPLFEAFREVAPNTRGIEPLYRSPICINTKTDDFFVGNYVH